MYTGELSREDVASIVELWNTHKPPEVVKASGRDSAWLGHALDDAANESETPILWLRGKMQEYLASQQAKTHPTTLRNFLRTRKYLEDAEIWNHGKKPAWNPVEQTRLRLAEPPPPNEAIEWAKRASDAELEAAAIRVVGLFPYLRQKVGTENGGVDVARLRGSPLCLSLAYGGRSA